MYLHNFVFQKYTFRKYIIDALYTHKSIFTPSGTVFSTLIALELLSETVRNKWRHNDAISCHCDITVSVVIRISGGSLVEWLEPELHEGQGGRVAKALPGPRWSKKGRSE